MLRTGDFVVPRIHGVSDFMSARPPLQMWMIAASSFLSGEVDIFAVRFPSVLAVMLLPLLLYYYSRTFLTRWGAFCTSVVYISMLQVLELGRTGETDQLFTLFVAGSLLSWHAGYVKKWNPMVVWSLGYGFCALATLTKGPQAPVYFAAPVFGYLILSGSWRFLFRWGHFAGMLTFLLLWGPWQTLYSLSEGWEKTKFLYFGDINRYGHSESLWNHLWEYPLQTIVAVLPWCCVLSPSVPKT